MWDMVWFQLVKDPLKYAATTSSSKSCSLGWRFVLHGAEADGLRMHWLCNNKVVVHTVKKRFCCNPDMMRLRGMVQFELVVFHVPGRENMLADDRSHNCLSDLLSKAQSPNPAPASMLLELPEVLLDQMGWASPCWMRRFFINATAVTPCREHTELV